MVTGMLSGLFWAFETILIGFAMNSKDLNALFITPFICTFFHDAFSAFWITCHNTTRGNFLEVLSVLKTSHAKYVSLAAIIGGPIGMSGYMITIHYLGSSIGAVVSAIFPAVGAVLAVIFLKEKMKWYQWIFLLLTLFGVYGINYSSQVNVVNFGLGLIGACMCAFGWGIEAVILAKCLKDDCLKNEYALQIRQTTSAIVYGCVLVPFLMNSNVGVHFFQWRTLLWIGVAALFATLSYLFYYQAIYKVGASKAMALNITYVAWAMILTCAFFGSAANLTPMTVGCALLVLVCSILVTFDFKRKNV